MRDCVRVLIAAPALAALVFNNAQGAPSAQSRTADDWYAQAVEATLAGDLEGRQQALDAAIEVDPQHAPSRGERGEVRDGDRWVSAWYAQRLAADDADREAYLDRLQAIDNTPAAHARMAKWCDKVGLTPEARPHLVAILNSDPDNAVALEELGLVRRDGQLLDAEVIAKADARKEELVRSAKDWEKRFRRFESKRHLDEEELGRIREELDVGAIEPIENRIAMLSQTSDPELAERLELLVQAFLKRSIALPEIEVTASLSRIAIFGGDSHRAAAIKTLESRPKFDVMPMLLSHLIAPVDSDHRITRDVQGNVIYQHRLKRENAEHDEIHDRNRTASVGVGINSAAPQGFRSYTTSEALYLAAIQARFEGVKQAIEYQTEAEITNAAVAAHNAIAEEFNSRIEEALTQVAGRSMGETPREWWEAWRRFSGYDTYDRGTERTYDVTYTHQRVTATPTYERIPPPPPGQRCECFVAGTPVWTRDGKQAIETLKAGDLVMARDPHRGGIVYRVVTETTVREPSPMVEVVAGGESIHATVGHPFWVIGSGWTMAKELSEGDILSTIDGPVVVSSVNEYENATAYNLVVEGAANYYVGEHGVLVHDNTPRVPAVGLVARR
ncbi:polymorphic toxin-type HINT domain-containing protein [Botrimarina mediterranea]|uniref:Hint domain-containing protein n=1 Tax=Botrimarina mediterranea TaxID=2528022 RepID=A0A518K481_9BACT|nr:polymorphic toxin-type HINT domain-containing protein [Botrimarina mediterranea]QDV72575.1 hypothetical protein Spa11_07540 [Botrimarina mediterranea]QDV77147.1 hypothetical protein K2D_07350 [Planctomycetes bacterium K2D]